MNKESIGDTILENEECSRIWKEYEDGKAYQDSMGFRNDFPQIIRFKEGNQWPAPTKKTRNFPRPVFNFTEMFVKNKRAAVTNQTLSMTYFPLEIEESDEAAKQLAEKGARDYSDYSKIVWENVDQDELNNEFVDDAITLGTGVLHYYWDNTITGGRKLEYVGALCGEVIDVLNIFFANPRIRNIQKQPWIILETRMSVKNARKLAEENGASELEIDLIKPDNYREIYDNDSKINEDDDVTVLVKYFKKNGEVFYSKSTQTVMLVKNKSLTPNIEGISNVEINVEETQMSESIEFNIENPIKEHAKNTLYPVVILPCKRRKKCIYGIGEVQDIIPSNKLYNQLKGMEGLNVIRTGNPNVISKKGALKQQLTNEGGQLIVDYWMGNGDGVKYMQPPNFTNAFSKLGTEIFEMARTITGVTDVSTGEVTGANMAASAIIALQNQAKTPIKEFQTRFYSAMKEVGDIWCEFYKTYYSTVRKMSIQKDNKMETRDFRGTDYAGIDFKTKIEVIASAEKESITMSVLENLKASGDIDKTQYIELMPDTAVPFKAELKKMWENENKKDQLLMQAMEQIKMYQEMLGINKNQGGMSNEVQTLPNGNVN